MLRFLLDWEYLCPRRNICLVSLMEQRFLIRPLGYSVRACKHRGEVHS